MDDLGINLFSLILNLVIFFVFYMFIHKFFLPKINKILQERADVYKKIEKNLEEAESTTQKAVYDYERRIEEAKHQANSIIENSQKQSYEQSESIIENARNEAKIIVNEAVLSATAYKKELDSEFDKKVLTVTKGVLKEILSSETATAKFIKDN